ncbi:MAG: hypothetical protein ACRDTF_21650 [Pseudonocardiaceae bacterium]
MKDRDNQTGQGLSNGRPPPPAVPVKARHTPAPAVMQRNNERSRVVMDGRRTDDGDRCTLIMIHEVGDTWVFYPHGAGQFGVRLTKVDAVKVAQVVLAGAQ